ncbi:MAG: MBL fold metallo-hydrolase [Deferribacteraceae bacterium]|nr:MBL fold metallo-hydrolase [Deferribacteraceae bacterium]
MSVKRVVKKVVKIILILIAAEIVIGGIAAYSVWVRIGAEPPSFDLDYYKNGRFIFPVNPNPVYRPLREADKTAKRGVAGWIRFLSRSPNAPEFELEKVKLKKYEFPNTPEKYSVYWLGHSTAIFELNGVRVITDPVFGYASPFFLAARRYDAPPLPRGELPNIDLALISHDHYDHLEYATMKHLKKTRTIFVVPLGVGTHLRKWGIDSMRIRELGWGDSFEYKDIVITAEKTIHWTGRLPKHRNKTLAVSYVIASKDKKIFFSGDTGYGEHFKEIREKHGEFDLAAIEIDGWNPRWKDIHLFPDEVLSAAKDLGAKLLLPVHWGAYDLAYHRWDESIREVTRLSIENAQSIASPRMGEKLKPDEFLKQEGGDGTVWWMYQKK